VTWIESEPPEDELEYTKKKLRLLADEDVDDRIVNTLRDRGIDIATVREQGYAGRDDSDIYQLARKEKRVLLTFNGKDFLNQGFFPLQSCPGVLWLDFPRDESHLGEAVFDILEFRWIGDWKTKIRLKPDWNFDVWSLDSTGQVGKKTFRFIGKRIEEWRD